MRRVVEHYNLHPVDFASLFSDEDIAKQYAVLDALLTEEKGHQRGEDTRG